jgi:phosphate transport system permease protein
VAVRQLTPPGAAPGAPVVFRGVSTWRRVVARGVMGIALLATALALFPLVDIVMVVVSKGVRALGVDIFTTVTNGLSGGLQNAIFGTALLVSVALVLAGPVGVGAGVYLAQWSSPRVAGWLRYLTDVLTGVPSIVVGYFLFATLVVSTGGLGWGFSLLAGSISLAIMMLPYIVRTTELALRKVPPTLREGSLALGVTEMGTLARIQLPAASGSILTGILLALGIGLGETAPLLYTAGWSAYDPTLQLTHSPVGYLTYVIWTFINQPFAQSHALAYTAALLIMVGVLGLNFAARAILVMRERRLST